MNATESNFSTLHKNQSENNVDMAFNMISMFFSILIIIGHTLVIISIARYRPLQIKANGPFFMSGLDMFLR